MSQSVTALFLLLLPTLCAGEMAEMAAEYELLVVNYGNSTGGNSTDPSSENEMAQDIVGYTLIGILVLMFFFTVCTFGKDCCVGCKNVSGSILVSRRLMMVVMHDVLRNSIGEMMFLRLIRFIPSLL